MKKYRVYLKDYASIGTMCGYYDCSTLKEAQEKALKIARRDYSQDAELEKSGYTVGFYTRSRC